MPCSEHHENLLVTIPGRSRGRAILFEAHVDTVPADEWAERAFTPRREADKVTGRGACDDKGSLTAMILAILDLMESRTVPPHPILFLAAGDEEYAQTGIRQFIKKSRSIAAAVFGEGTSLAPVIQHKGTVRWDIIVHGKSAHTSQPELGHNAILDAVTVIQLIQQYQGKLQLAHTSPFMSGPTITVTQINGGTTRNSVPHQCKLAIDFRILPGMDPGREREKLIDHLKNPQLNLTHEPVQSQTPPLDTSPTDSFSLRVLDVCKTHGGSRLRLSGVSYGTDASWISDRTPAVVLGPGNIADAAHAVDEHISLNELTKCAEIYRDIMALVL